MRDNATTAISVIKIAQKNQSFNLKDWFSFLAKKLETIQLATTNNNKKLILKTAVTNPDKIVSRENKNKYSIAKTMNNHFRKTFFLMK